MRAGERPWLRTLCAARLGVTCSSRSAAHLASCSSPDPRGEGQSAGRERGAPLRPARAAAESGHSLAVPGPTCFLAPGGRNRCPTCGHRLSWCLLTTGTGKSLGPPVGSRGWRGPHCWGPEQAKLLGPGCSISPPAPPPLLSLSSLLTADPGRLLAINLGFHASVSTLCHHSPPAAPRRGSSISLLLMRKYLAEKGSPPRTAVRSGAIHHSRTCATEEPLTHSAVRQKMGGGFSAGIGVTVLSGARRMWRPWPGRLGAEAGPYRPGEVSHAQHHLGSQRDLSQWARKISADWGPGGDLRGRGGQ